MSWLSDYTHSISSWYLPARLGIWLQQYPLGWKNYQNKQSSLQTQMDYDQYLKVGYERALKDWKRNVPNRQIRYPELSYPGQIRRADTSVARAGFDYSSADASYYGSLPYRASGLYGIASRLSRYM